MTESLTKIRNEKALVLMDEWLADESIYDEDVWLVMLETGFPESHYPSLAES